MGRPMTDRRQPAEGLAQRILNRLECELGSNHAEVLAFDEEIRARPSHPAVGGAKVRTPAYFIACQVWLAVGVSTNGWAAAFGCVMGLTYLAIYVWETWRNP